MNEAGDQYVECDVCGITITPCDYYKYDGLCEDCKIERDGALFEIEAKMTLKDKATERLKRHGFRLKKGFYRKRNGSIKFEWPTDKHTIVSTFTLAQIVEVKDLPVYIDIDGDYWIGELTTLHDRFNGYAPFCLADMDVKQ